MSGGLGLAALLAAGGWPKLAGAGLHPAARAKNIIYILLAGGASQIDLFDPKPELVRRDGERCPDELFEGKRLAFIRSHPTLLGSPYEFKKHGQSGADVSELLPHLASVTHEMAHTQHGRLVPRWGDVIHVDAVCAIISHVPRAVATLRRLCMPGVYDAEVASGNTPPLDVDFGAVERRRGFVVNSCSLSTSHTTSYAVSEIAVYTFTKLS